MNYKNIIERIKDRIELYNDCYEGTPDEVIKYITEVIEEGERNARKTI